MNLSVVIPCKNRKDNLTLCLASINACRTVPKVFVVDFGSDVSLKAFENKYPWLTVLRTTNNIGLFHKARAINIGIRHINTRFFCTTDADQLFQPNFFSVVYNVLNKESKSLVLCKTTFISKKPKNMSNYKKLLEQAKQEGRKIHGEGCCVGIKTKWLKQVGGWDEQYKGYGAEDSDLILRAKLAGFKPIWINKFTSMIHLPHDKTGVYYSKKVFLNNKNKYIRRKNKKDIVVNKKINWGTL